MPSAVIDAADNDSWTGAVLFLLCSYVSVILSLCSALHYSSWEGHVAIVTELIKLKVHELSCLALLLTMNDRPM